MLSSGATAVLYHMLAAVQMCLMHSCQEQTAVYC